MMKTFCTFFAFVLLATIIGCGQKGPLYLPENTIDLDKASQTPEKQTVKDSTETGEKITPETNPKTNTKTDNKTKK